MSPGAVFGGVSSRKNVNCPGDLSVDLLTLLPVAFDSIDRRHDVLVLVLGASFPRVAESASPTSSMLDFCAEVSEFVVIGLFAP